jgi:hypothetical protein
MVDPTLPVVEGCTAVWRFDAFGETRDVEYCQFRHAFICRRCRPNYLKRTKAMIRGGLPWKCRRPQLVWRDYERPLAEPEGCAGCS